MQSSYYEATEIHLLEGCLENGVRREEAVAASAVGLGRDPKGSVCAFPAS